MSRTSHLNMYTELSACPQAWCVLTNAEMESVNNAMHTKETRNHRNHSTDISMQPDTPINDHKTIEHKHLQQDTLEHNVSTTTIKIRFPFKWKYGQIKELAEKEKAEINRVRHRNRRRYQKPCCLCGEEGIIAFRKVSDGSSSLICKDCTERYVLSARAIEKRIA